MISQKTRTNAVIAYFFLGWIFLLARNNPDFSDPFIRQHAKTATKGHIIFLVGYFLYSHFLSRLFMHIVPLIGITFDRIIDLGIFSALTGFILFWADRAWKGDNAIEKPLLGDTEANSIIEYSSANEAERMILLLSFIPFFGRYISEKHPSKITVIGANISTLFALLYAISIVVSGFNSLTMVLLFFYVLLFVFFGARFFFSDSCPLPSVLLKIPSIEFIWQIIRSLPIYMRDILFVAIGKKDSLDFSETLRDVRAADLKFQESMASYFQDEKLPFSKLLIFIPLVNFLFIPKIFLSRNTKYVLAIGQGIIISLFTIAFIVFYDVWSRMQLLLVLPILLGMSAISHNAFYRIPVVYELYALLNTITFGLLENTRKIRAAKAKEQSVSFKVQ